MPCPTCSHTLHGCGYEIFHCPRCGTMKIRDEVYQPALVNRVHELREVMTARVGFHQFDRDAWDAVGIFEAIYTPEERKNL